MSLFKVFSTTETCNNSFLPLKTSKRIGRKKQNIQSFQQILILYELHICQAKILPLGMRSPPGEIILSVISFSLAHDKALLLTVPAHLNSAFN